MLVFGGRQSAETSRERERVVLSLFGMMYSIPLDVDTKKRTKKRPFEEGKTSLFFFFKFDTLNLSLCSLSVLFCLFFIFFLSSKIIVFETTRPKTRNSAFLFSFRPFLFRETTRSREREKEKHTRRERERKRLFIYIYIVLSRTPTERLAFSRREEEETTFESNRIRLVSSRGS